MRPLMQLAAQGGILGFSALFSPPGKSTSQIEMSPLQEEIDPLKAAENLRQQSEILSGALDRMGIEDEHINKLIDLANRQAAKKLAFEVINDQFRQLKKILEDSRVFRDYQIAGVLSALDSVKVELQIRLEDSVNVKGSSQDFISQMYSVFNKLEKYQTVIGCMPKKNDDPIFDKFEDSADKAEVERSLVGEKNTAVRDAMIQEAKNKFVFDQKVKCVEDTLISPDSSFFERRLGMQITMALFGAILLGLLTLPFVGPAALLFASAGFGLGFAAGNAIYSATASPKERLLEESLGALRAQSGYRSGGNLFAPFPLDPLDPANQYDYTACAFPGLGA